MFSKRASEDSDHQSADTDSKSVLPQAAIKTSNPPDSNPRSAIRIQ
ncbi:hypothetical protein GCWU000342_01382 [Shuttleworthella satelles DSM 14600]|uniref:Uncharacterized protein n=1 Tax=Shuttleworthella satelles DSM 14600 TaxID=626523 RepID=C4GBS9_9FIRM|nr:hypothetical protein GCWU000342_01382 [Shuttleworthia satelles DSM 14600]